MMRLIGFLKSIISKIKKVGFGRMIEPTSGFYSGGREPQTALRLYGVILCDSFGVGCGFLEEEATKNPEGVIH